MELVAAAAKHAVAYSGGEFEADLPVPSFVFKAENLCCIVDADALVWINLKRDKFG
jgi:hypothetical protein